MVVATGRVRPPTAAVLPDPDAAGILAARHLIGLGIRRLMWVDECDLWIGAARGDAFLREAERIGVPARRVEHADAVAAADAADHVGIACANDRAARRLLDQLGAAGAAVPARCALIGVDDDRVLAWNGPISLSSIDTDSAQVGWRAAQLAADLAGGAPAPASPLLVPPRGVVARRSSDVLAFADPHMAEAVRTIRARACSGRSIAALLDGLPVGRRSVERFYRRTFGRSPADELEELRLLEACRLLCSTALAVRAVGRACGYASARAFSRAFARVHGMPPAQYRTLRAALPDIR